MIWSWATCARRRAVEVRDAWAVWMRDAWTWLPIRLVWQRRMGWLTLLLVPFVCYPVLLCLLNVRLSRLFLTQKQAALDFMVLIARSVFVPGLVFWGGTLLRSRLHFPRPYEQPGFTPLVAKESRGHSMPSRHALSAAVLAAVWLYFYPAAGCVMVGVALLICCLRVLTGVHHVRDVVCGFALGFALGCAGMWLL